MTQLEIVALPSSPGSTEEDYTPVTLEQCMNVLEQPEQLPTFLIEGPPGIGKLEILKNLLSMGKI